MMNVSDRLDICEKCPLNNSWVCDSRMFLNPTTNELSFIGKKGYFNGCGCDIKIKVLNPSTRCPAGKWLAERDEDFKKD